MIKMIDNKKQMIHALFEKKDYIQLYEMEKETIQQMLLIESQEEFEDFLKYEEIEEDVFYLYDSAVQGESLLIGGYEGDISERVTTFLKQKLPKELFDMVASYLKNLYVDFDAKDNIEKQIAACNQHFKNTGYGLLLCYDESYCAGVYFLKVLHDGEK